MAAQKFNFVDGSFHFFQTLARRPGATLSLIVWHVIAYVALFTAFAFAILPVFPTIIELSETHADPDLTDILTIVGAIWLAMLIAYIGTIIVLLMVQGAWLRHLTHGRTAPGIPFRFGGDEWRLLGVNISFFVLNLLAFTVFFVVIGIVGYATGAHEDELGGVGVGSIMLLFPLFGLVWAFFAVRLAAAPAMSVNEGRFRLFSSFSATSKFWGWMVLCYLLVYVLVTLASTFISFFVIAVSAVGFADVMAAGHALAPDAGFSEVLSIFLRPVPLVSLGVGLVILLVLQVLVEAMWHSIGAYAARVIGGEAEPEPDYEVPTASVGDAPSEG